MSLYKFQQEDVETLVDRRRSMLCHQMGLGKTRIAALCLQRWGGRAIVFAKKNDLYMWEDEIEQNTLLKPLIYDGKPHERKKLRAAWSSGEFNVLLTHYAYVKEVLSEISKVFGSIVADEYHLYGLINRKSVTFKMFKLFESVNMLLLTGTPIRRNPSDLWGPLHLLDRKNYRSYWKFVSQYCTQVEDPWTGITEILPKAKNPKALRYLLYTRFMIRRTKDEIKEQLPSKKLRVIIPISMTKQQKKLYRDLSQDMLARIENAETEEELLYLVSTAAEKVLRLRQLLISPKLLGGSAYGAAIEHLTYNLRNDPDLHKAVFVTCPFREGVRVIEEAIKVRVGDHVEIYTIMGGMREGEAYYKIKRFQESTKQRVLVCTTRSATGFTATAAKIHYAIGAEWSAVDNVQAEDRIHRIGQTEDVVLNYYMHKETVERKVLRIVGQKMYAEKSALGK